MRKFTKDLVMNTLDLRLPSTENARDLHAFIASMTRIIGSSSYTFDSFASRFTSKDMETSWVVDKELYVKRRFNAEGAEHEISISFNGGGGMVMEVYAVEDSVATNRHTYFIFGIGLLERGKDKPKVDIYDARLYGTDTHSLWGLYPLVQALKTLNP